MGGEVGVVLFLSSLSLPPIGLPLVVEEEGEEEERCVWPTAEGAREEDAGESKREEEEEEGGVDGFCFCLSPDLGRAEEGEAEVVAFTLAAAEPGRPEGAREEGGGGDWDELEVAHPQ